MIEINNLVRLKISGKIVRDAIGKILLGEKRKMDVSVAFVSPTEIKKQNKRYRKKNRETDVLSYIYGKESGEIIICPQVVKKNAINYGQSFKKEFLRVLIHGTLHLLGYDHEKTQKEAAKMFSKESKYLNS